MLFISGYVVKDTYVLIFHYCWCAASVTVAARSAQFCDYAEHPSRVIWMHGGICVGVISAQALCKVCRLTPFHSLFCQMSKIVTGLNWPSSKGKVKKANS